MARKSSRRGDAGQFGQADRNGRILGVIQLVCNLHRLKTGGLFQIRLDTIHLVRVEREQIRERSDRSFLVMQTIWNDVDTKIGFINGSRLAIKVYAPSSK